MTSVENGMHYKCLRSSKQWSTRKGWIYVQEGDELVHYSSRYQTRLLNAKILLHLKDAFEVCVFVYPGECDCEDCRQKSNQKASLQ